jgi:glutathione S-transferase
VACSHEDERIQAVDEKKVQEAVEKIKSLLATLDTILDPADGPWLFGLSVPTALDANLVPLLARLREVGKADMISEGLAKYADAAMEKVEWKSVMEGRKTLFGL